MSDAFKCDYCGETFRGRPYSEWGRYPWLTSNAFAFCKGCDGIMYKLLVQSKTRPKEGTWTSRVLDLLHRSRTN